MALMQNLLTRLLALGRAKPNPTGQGRGYGMRSTSGRRVTHSQAELVSVVWACMDALAAPMASSDWNVYAGRRHGNKKTTQPDSDLQFVLNTRFNEEMTAQSGKRALMLAAVSYGYGIAEIGRNLANRINALYPLHPDRVEPHRDLDTGELFFRVTNQLGATVDIKQEDVFIIRGPGLSGFVGDDMVAKAVQSIAIALAQDEFTNSYYSNGAQLGGTLTFPKNLSDTQYERLKEQFDEKHMGARNANKWAIVEGGGSVTPFNHDAQKAQIVDAKYVTIEDICRFFRVPPHKVAHLLRATNNNIEHQGLEFTGDSLRPWKVEIEQEADYKLVPWRSQQFIEIDLDWAQQGDYASRAQAYQSLRECGVFTANDVLRKLGENTIGPEGDVHTINSAAIPLKDVGKNLAPTTTPPKPPSKGTP